MAYKVTREKVRTKFPLGCMIGMYHKNVRYPEFVGYCVGYTNHLPEPEVIIM